MGISISTERDGRNPVVSPPDEQPAPGATGPEDVYREREARFKGLFDAETRLWDRIANFRLLAFALAAVALGWGLWQSISLLTWTGVLFSVIFGALVGYHRAVGRRRRCYETLWKINLEGGWRVARAWDQLPLRHTVRAAPGEPYAADLDIFGHASLFQLLDTTTTHAGEATLASWLRLPAPPQALRARQGAAAELAPMLDLRDDLELRGRLAGDGRTDPERFLQWAESGSWLARRPWLRWGATASVVVLWLLIILQVAGIVPYPVWMLLAGANLVFALTVGRRVYSLLAAAGAEESGFRHYGPAFALISGAQFHAALLKGLQARLGKDGVEASASVRRLYKLTGFLIPASASLYIPAQVFALWDVHLLAAFERWQATAGKQARDWVRALGEMEALSALARLAHDNPAWAFPEVDEAANRLQARRLGHPLIPADKRVDNDVEVGPPGTFLLVTGSNMSGKSTLLRSVGVNIVLAQAGGPACASYLRLSPVDLWTSMRVEDSLERGISFYMAELQRLKEVVDAARIDRTAGERRLFYLLDEILQGTNTAERQIAARRVIMYLVRQGALGAVSTHDLTLPDAPDIASAARSVHFTETLSGGQGGPAMTFDYKLRPGIATSTNALRLMQIVGLDLDETAEEGPATAVVHGV